MGQAMKDVNTDSGDSEGLYPIRTVSSLTGVNAITLRAWERRYGLIKPDRTPKGHRVYTKHDINLIHRVVALLESGVSIGQAGDHLDSTAKPGRRAFGAKDRWQNYQNDLLSAVERYDEVELDGTYTEALSLYPTEIVTENLIRPVLRELGDSWREDGVGVSHEHFFVTYLRNKLGARLNNLIGRHCHTKILACCIPQEQHEIGLLLFCLGAAEQGFSFVILGANTPLEELPDVVRRSNCKAILLSGSGPNMNNITAVALAGLVESSQVPVYVGGIIAVECNSQIKRSGAQALGTEFNAALRTLSRQLHSEHAVL